MQVARALQIVVHVNPIDKSLSLLQSPHLAGLFAATAAAHTALQAGMPTITVQVGQCGNQLGSSMWALLAEQQRVLDRRMRHASLEFFCTDGAPRCVAVDTEAKVIGALHRDAPGPLQRQQHVLSHSGCGNNWSVAMLCTCC